MLRSMGWRNTGAPELQSIGCGYLFSPVPPRQLFVSYRSNILFRGRRNDLPGKTMNS